MHKIKPELIKFNLRCLALDCGKPFMTNASQVADGNILCPLCGTKTALVSVEVPTPRMIAFIEGGVFHDIMADAPMQVRVIDYDVEGADEVDKIRLVGENNALCEEAHSARVLKYDLGGEEDLTPFFSQDVIG
jgi:hypothetical protein